MSPKSDAAEGGEPAPPPPSEYVDEDDDGLLLLLPARPIRSRLALWIPRAATVASLGLTCWLAPRAGVSALALAFFGTDAGERRIASYDSWNLTSAFLIWTVEGYRAGNALTPLAVPSIFGAAVQVFGIEKVAPIHYIFSIIAGSGVLSGRSKQLDPDVAKAVLPATILGHALPVALMSLLPMTATEVSRSHFTLQSIACHLFYLSPLAVSALTALSSKALGWFRQKFEVGARLSPIDEKKPVGAERHGQHAPGSEVPALKTAYAVVFGLQAIKHLSTATWVLQKYHDNMARLPAPFSMLAGALGKLLERTPSDATASTTAEPLGAYKLATALFGFHTVWDLRRRGYTTTDQTVQAMVVFNGLLDLCGVGAGYAGLWYWRETVLARLRHSG